jgi:hypothetical protein
LSGDQTAKCKGLCCQRSAFDIKTLRLVQDSRSDDRLLCVEELAGLAVLEGRPEVARQLFEHAAGWGNVVPTLRFLRVWGLFESREGNVSAARALFRRATEMHAMDVPTWLAWALMERREGNLKECMRLLREVGGPDCNTAYSITFTSCHR